MTTPVLAKSGKGGWNPPRVYSWPPHPPHEFEVISVTSAIERGWPKPFLIGWAAKVTAESAVDDHAIVGKMIEQGQERRAISYLKDARWNQSGEKADRGTVVHLAIESYLKGSPLTKEQMESELEERRVSREMWKSTAKMYSGLLEFFYDEEPEILWSEATLFSRQHGYAGTADIIGRMRIGGQRMPVILDFKTSKSIYNDTALQLSAYAGADFIGLQDGTELPLAAELDGEVIQYGVVVRPTPSGKYEKGVFALTPELFSTFLSVLHTAKNVETVETARRPG